MGICAAKETADGKRLQLAALTLETADEMTYDFTEAKVLKVYDGDTITIGTYFAGSMRKFNVRLYGVDCDEMKGGTAQTKRNAILARDFVRDRVLDKIIKINVLNGKIYDGKKITEKYGRLLAIVIDPSGENLNDLLITKRLARRYDGGTKSNDRLDPISDE